MTFKKRIWIPCLVIVFYATACNSSFLKMRTDDNVLLEEIGPGASASYYDYEERKMHYIKTAEKKSTAIIFIHGSPGSIDAYLDYLKDPKLKEVATLIAVDRPGFGFSDFGKTEVSIKKQAEAIGALIEDLEGEHVILVGHSLGGPVIAQMGMLNQESVDGLVFIAPSIDPELEAKEWWRKPLNWKAIRWMVPRALRVCNQEILPLYSELERMLPDWQSIKAHTIIYQGDDDNLVPKENADFAEKMLVNAKSIETNIIKDGNHFILWSEKDRIVNSILRLIQKLENEES